MICICGITDIESSIFEVSEGDLDKRLITKGGEREGDM